MRSLNPACASSTASARRATLTCLMRKPRRTRRGRRPRPSSNGCVSLRGRAPPAPFALTWELQGKSTMNPDLGLGSSRVDRYDSANPEPPEVANEPRFFDSEKVRGARAFARWIVKIEHASARFHATDARRPESTRVGRGRWILVAREPQFDRRDRAGALPRRALCIPTARAIRPANTRAAARGDLESGRARGHPPQRSAHRRR